MSSRKEERERLRRERVERERAAAASAGRRRKLGLMVIAILAVAGSVAGLIALFAGAGAGAGGGGGGGKWPDATAPARKTRDLRTAIASSGCVLNKPKNAGAGHTEEKVKYKMNPPTSGGHSPVPASDGTYTKSPPIENLVHSLEHGRVIFYFRPGAPAKVRGVLKKIYDEDPAITLLTVNNTKMPYEVAAVAWDNMLACRAYSDRVADAFRAFREEYRLQAPEYIPDPQ